ncbi:long-chain-fatty-acid--CoA ligase 1-like isoform X3 [Petromyzon marinus]|uniref:long-chain-fatty-acid--CoA ligase 1-like isoform X3 n=1 Tax=Petromyzon marinus TaxID=7757 RepID=UPI003F72C93D
MLTTPGHLPTQGTVRKTKLRGWLSIPAIGHEMAWVEEYIPWRTQMLSIGGLLENVWGSMPPSAWLGVGTASLFTGYWYLSRPRPICPPCQLTQQSVEVEGQDGVRRSALLKKDKLLEFYYEDAKTMYEVFHRGMRVSKNGPCLGYRKPKKPYQWMSYKEVAERSEWFGSGLIHKGCRPATDQFIGVFAQNRPEWIITEQACYMYSMVVVPLYDTLGQEAICFIINRAEIAVVVCDTVERARVLLRGVENRETPGLRTVVVMETPDLGLIQWGITCRVDVLSFQYIEDCGRMHKRTTLPPKPEDLAIVCFTSGTTGNPKGAMLTHRNIVSDMSGFLKVTESLFLPETSDIAISYLPLAHMFERLVQATLFCHGASIGFFQGDVRLLLDDMQALRPTVFPVVPRILNRMYDKVLGSTRTPFRRKLLEFGARRKMAELQRGVVRRNSLWDWLVFRPMQLSVGGRVRMIMTGAAPISPGVLNFLRVVMGCQMYEGYGQTECTAGCTLTLPGDWKAGHVGAPMPCNYIKLHDVKDMEYYTSQGKGEVCVKGPNVFKGYLKDAEKTAEAVDRDGWLHTGDIGQWMPNGTLKIIDRKKHIFKLAQGEYIAPEKIENVYSRCEPVAQVYVHGDSLQACLVAVVVPDPEILCCWIRKKGIVGTYSELCRNKEVRQAILEDMQRLGKESDLQPFEQVKDVHLHNEMFSIENGLLTPTFKAKRTELRTHFRSVISSMYQNVKA